jgi:hypothetical protein
MNATLRDQLQPLQDQLRSARPEVRPIVQVTCGLAGAPVEAVQYARAAILNWLRDKQRIQNMPVQAWEGESFEMDASMGQPIAVEAHGSVWAMRYDNADIEVPSRTWRTDAILAWRGDLALVGVRLSVISRKWDVPVMKSVPRAVLALCHSPGLRDYGYDLEPTAIDIREPHEIGKLVALLECQQRTRPVYVVSADATGKFSIDADRLASQTAALAHVIKLHPPAAWALSERIGKTHSVFGGAIRTYYPGFQTLTAPSFDSHPIATKEWLERRFENVRQFADLLALKAIDVSVTSSNLEQSLPTFSAVRRGLAEKRLQEARSGRATDQELVRLYEDDNANLRVDLAAAEDLVLQAEERVAVERQQVERLEAEKFLLRSRIQQLEQSLKAKGREEIVEYPGSLVELDAWVARFLGDHLVLLPRALRSARKAEFDDLQLVCDSLMLLGREYRDQKLGLVSRGYFDDAARELGVLVSRSGDDARLLQWREEYEVEWHGEKRLLDMHLKKGTSREPRNSLRVYFFFDAEREQVVVGHLPTHLTNDLT